MHRSVLYWQSESRAHASYERDVAARHPLSAPSTRIATPPHHKRIVMLVLLGRSSACTKFSPRARAHGLGTHPDVGKSVPPAVRVAHASVPGYVQSLIVLQRSMQVPNASPSSCAQTPAPWMLIGQSAALAQCVTVQSWSMPAPLCTLVQLVPETHTALAQLEYGGPVPVVPLPGKHTCVLAPDG
jgi:hypothetical protein